MLRDLLVGQDVGEPNLNVATSTVEVGSLRFLQDKGNQQPP